MYEKNRAYRILKSITFVSIFILVSAVLANAQTSPVDGITPQGIAPGSPSGSYSLSGFDSINPYNGNLDFHLPLLNINGRGDARTIMMLAINSKSWRVKHSSTIINGEPVE